MRRLVEQVVTSMELTMSWNRTTHRIKYGLGRMANQIKVLTLTALVAAPLGGSRMPSELELVKASGKLVVVSRNGPTTYYEGSNGYTGFEYHLLSAFAKHLNVDLEIIEQEDLDRMIDNIGVAGHFAAAGLTVTPKRQRQVRFTRSYMDVSQQLIYHTSQPRPERVEDLIGKNILVIGGSSHAERLRQLQKHYPDLAWEERYDVEMLDLLEMVHNQKIEYAIVDSNALELNSALYPKAKVAFEISSAEHIAWAFPRSNDTSLLDAANDFLQQLQLSGELADIKDTFYGHLGEIGYSDALVFARRMESRLPKWKDALKQAATENHLDWLLLAALSYQESHWNPKAKSPTGVRGFMMLTQSTAREMKIKNRLNPFDSIKGGSQYFKKMLARIPETVTGPDRVWFALASYNVGFGHLEDARVLTQQHGANPNKWSDVKDYLPLLSKRQYYKFTKHGFARGQEAVGYVQNIRNFYTVLAWNEVEQERLTEVAINDNAGEESEFNHIISEVVANQLFVSNTSM